MAVEKTASQSEGDAPAGGRPAPGARSRSRSELVNSLLARYGVLLAFAAVSLMSMHHWGWGIALILALALGIGVGTANGFLISYLGGPSFIITLAMGTVLTGIEFLLTKQTTIFSGVATSYTHIAQNTFL